MSPLDSRDQLSAFPPILTRRRLLQGAISAGVVGSLLAACSPAAPGGAPSSATSEPAATAGPGGFANVGTLKLLMSSHFVPAYDTWFDQWASDWGARNKVEIQVDHILSTDLAAKNAAEVAAKGGHDIYKLTRNGEPALYHDYMVDVGDLTKQIGEAHGGWIPFGETLGLYQGAWHAIPEYFIDFPALYRKDIFDANGLQPVDTWDDLLQVGTLLKTKGNPIGIAINQKSNDANNTWTGVLWSHGGSVVAEDGKTVALDSQATRDALNYAIELYNKAMTNEVLSWDDTGNNLLLAGGRGSWIQNPISALRTIEHDTPDLAQKIFVSNTPAGPKGRMTSVGGNSWAIASWAVSVPAAKAMLLDYYAILPEAIKASTGYNQPVLNEFRKKPMPILGEDPKLTVLQDFDQVIHATGYPGPITAAAGEVESNWIIPLMVGRAVNDGDVNGAVEWGTQKVQAIYDKYA
ncbi:MAG: extracellular solute-binding protein [Chloroflexi bacterium]|nr:extracellular solute-binding protein [Chloroflexota bacterium]